MRAGSKVLAVLAAGCTAVLMIGIRVHADAPPGHFTDLGDGTVRDNATGLIWQQGFSPSELPQAECVAYCTTLTTSGGGWRLPSLLELCSIVDETRSDPAIDLSVFPGTPMASSFWSSSPVPGRPFYGWYVDHFDGDPSFAYGSGVPRRARCVR